MDKKRIYVVSTSHLDTSWLWTLETSIKRYIPETFNENFSLFAKYPEYKFSWEGTYRYELMEEYYPKAFEKVQRFAAAGRWFPSGSCFENGDVNVPSPEALTRNILYGSLYFREKLGKTSNDIYLPDCFGFGAALPSVAAHAGLKGFTSGKLSWGSANGVPFDIGKWYGNDGNFLFATLAPGSYIRSFKTVRNHPEFIEKLNKNISLFDLPMTFTYQGAGDRGGAAADYSAANVAREESENRNSDIDVINASTSKLFEDLDALSDDAKAKLPEWHGELLMTEHGAGSYTSRAVGKRFNRRCEQLADAAERTAAAANWVRGYSYPRDTFERAWKRVLAHQFHDDITGTSIMECYQRNWNDYIQSLNSFAGEYTSAVSALSGAAATAFCKGTPVVVTNPLQWERSESVKAEVSLDTDLPGVKVFDSKGKEVFSQLVSKADGKATVIFSAKVPPLGLRVYDIRPCADSCGLESSLKVTGNVFENSLVRVTLDKNGDISSIIDKASGREALKYPVRLGLLNDTESRDWPAWEVKYKDLMRPVREFARACEITLVESGAARVTFKITKKAGGSVFTQLVSLDEGSPYIRVYNEVDWRSSRTLLKAVFSAAATNENASYDIGLGSISRPCNTEKQFEVPAQMWADITDNSGAFGLSVFSDSRSGWDKPDCNTIRLTCVHTPISSFRWQCAQHLMDLGLNRFSFGLFPHKGGTENGTEKYAAEFNQPLGVFETARHRGGLGSEFSFGTVSDDNVVLRCVKLAERSDSLIVRFNNTQPSEKKGIVFEIGKGIAAAKEINSLGDEIGEASVEDGKLVFDIGSNGLKSFALTLVPFRKRPVTMKEYPVVLPLDSKLITGQDETDLASTSNHCSVPAEILPDSITCGGVTFPVPKGEADSMICSGKAITLPEGSTKLHVLAISEENAEIRFDFGDSYATRTVPSSFERIGAWDMVGLGETGFIKKEDLAFTATHTHSPAGDIVAKQLYIFRFDVDIPDGAESVEITSGKKVYILSAVTTEEYRGFAPAAELYDSLEKRPFDYTITPYEKKYASPLLIEKIVYSVVPKETTFFLHSKKRTRGKQITDIFCDNRNKFNGRK